MQEPTYRKQCFNVSHFITVKPQHNKGDVYQGHNKQGNTANLYEVNNQNTSKRCQICSKLKIKTPERRQ